MKNPIKRNSAFTLIELLMVIAIIGILAGILIPAVGAVKKQANIAAGKAQLSNYVNAVELFKGEYKFYPWVTGGNDETRLDVNSSANNFIETLSGKSTDGSSSHAGWQDTNRRRIGFHSFSDSEFFVNDSDVVSEDILADRFNNQNIFMAIDGDGDGFVRPDGASDDLRTPVTAYVEEDTDSNPAYQLWD